MKEKELKVRYKKIRDSYLTSCRVLMEDLRDHIEKVEKGDLPTCPLDYTNVSHILEPHGALRELDILLDDLKTTKKVTKPKKLKPKTDSPLKKALDVLLPEKKSSLEGWFDVIIGKDK